VANIPVTRLSGSVQRHFIPLKAAKISSRAGRRFLPSSVSAASTGEVIQAAVYFICNPALVWHKKDEQNEKDRVLIMSKRAREQLIKLKAQSTIEAIREMNTMVKTLWIPENNYRNLERQ
jgi:hypothetical protein